jgi:hypothetical protein
VGVGTAEIAVRALTSIPVLAFVLGVVATRAKADVRLPEPIYAALSIYLLLGIGIKGGVGLRESGIMAALGPVTAALLLGVVIPFIALAVSRLLTRLDPINRAALAAHYGSTSLVTFTAALVFLDLAAIEYEGFVATLLAVMEVPAIVIAIVIAGRMRPAGAGRGSPREAIQEVLTSRSIVLLIGGLAIGYLSGPVGYEAVKPFFSGMFQGALALFLLEMGALVGKRLNDLRLAGAGLVAFALVMPVIGGGLGVVAGALVGLSVGGTTVLGVLAASASYIAAPAAVRLALPEANPAFYLTASLGITFPFNLVVGIPLINALAQAIIGG